MIVYLRYSKDKIIDRDKFYKTYTSANGTYKMLNGTPLLVSVEGTLINSSSIMDLVVNRNQRVLSAVNRWLMDLRMPSNVNDGEILNFRWRR